MERATKQRKLNDFREGLPHCSQTALSAILQKVKAQGLPEVMSQKDIKAGSDQLLNNFDWYGPLWQQSEGYTTQGKSVNLAHINALSLVAGLFNAGGCFTHLIERLHSSSPSSARKPWRMILYSDEVHPGNQLSSGSKKCWAVYMAFLEYGEDLHQEELWLPLFVCRSSIVEQLASSIGQVFKLLLEAMFTNPARNPLHGLRLKGPDGQHLVLYWTLAMFLQDGSAHKFTYSNKQDSGCRVCMLCKNIFLSKAIAARDEEGEEAQPTLANFIKVKDSQVASDIEILESWKRMQQRRSEVSKSDFKNWCKVAGLDYSPHALLLSPILNKLGLLLPITQYCHDIMHCLCSKGALSYVIFWTLNAVCDSGMTTVWEDLLAYLQLWVPPHAFKAVKPHSLFTAKNVESHKSHKYIKCSASEMLSLVAPLRYFLQSCVLSKGYLQAECTCCLAWFDILDFCVSIPLLQKPDPQHLASLVERALQLLVDAGWGDSMRPKMHWPLHWAQELRHFGALPACWSVERKHKAIRRVGGNCCNLKVYDQFVMREVLAEQVGLLTKEHEEIGSHVSLIKAKKPDKTLYKLLAQHSLVLGDQQCLYSRSCRLGNGLLVTAGDAVFLHGAIAGRAQCGFVWAFLASGTSEMALLEEMPMLEYQADRHAFKFNAASKTICLAPVTSLAAPVVFSKGQDVLTCLFPAHLKADMVQK